MGQTVNLLAYAFGGSNPSLPTLSCGSSSVDRALAFQAEGRGFEPRLPLYKRRGCVAFTQPLLFLGGMFLGKTKKTGTDYADNLRCCLCLIRFRLLGLEACREEGG